MELATNLFTKGLQLDTHPMVQGNDTLTDCLNGTLITMNGNEVILLNDMGNRRVDNAFLPSGYLPVGMKEYGGIIYVAAYNPITNKSLIGSFPSPQKKIDSLDDSGLKGTLNFEDFLNESNVELDSNLRIKVIKSDSIMTPITGDTSLRAGDKFAIYASGLSSKWSDLTNYNNTSGNKAISPKNRKYTLQIGILNSQNEFVDITKTLCRWKNNVIQTYSEEKSDTFKFNDGYFISDDYTDKLSGDTIDDTKLIKKRQKMAANTYAYKLIGPMYLKATLNHIENFNYNIYGTCEKNGNSYNATLWIEGYLNYNCPDGFTGEAGSSNEDYITFSEGQPTFNGFDLIGRSKESLSVENSIYSPNNNIYSTKIVKKYTNITPNMSDDKTYEYIIGVNAADASNIYLRGLSVKGQLDLSLLGSGKVSVNGWRFYNNLELKSTTLTFSFNAYPEYGKSFGNLRFTFIIPGSGAAGTYPREGGLPLYNGRLNYTINWEDIGLNPRRTYVVSAKYDIINNNTGSVESTEELYNTDKDSKGISIVRWLLTTELFNEFYQPSAGVPDFCDPLKTEDSEALEAFKAKMVVSLKGEDTISNNSNKLEDKYDGGMTSSNTKIEYNCTHGYQVNINSNPTLKIVNEELYPTYVYIKNEHKNDLVVNSVAVLKIGNIETPTDYDSIFKSLLSITKGDNISTYEKLETDFKNLTTLEVDINNNGNRITGTIKHYDRYLGYSQKGLQDVENVFNSVEKLITLAGPKDGFYGGIQINCDPRGGDDGHFVDVYHELSKTYPNGHTQMLNAGLALTGTPDDADLWEGGFRAWEEHDDRTKTVLFKNISPQIFGYFSSGTYNGQMFMFVFPSLDVYYNNTGGWEDPKRGNLYARVWWRSSDGEWALFRDMINSNESFGSYIKDKFSKTYVYCMYDTYLGEISNIHATEDVNIYYDKYSIPITLSVDYKTKDNISVEDILNVTPNVGNLKFSGNPVISKNSTLITFNLDSSEKFLDTIKSFDISSISNIDISTGLMMDSKGRTLNPNYIYYVETLSSGKKLLVRVDNTYIQVDTDNKINTAEGNINTLVYNRNTLGVPSYRYDHAGAGSDNHTILDFNLTNIVLGI